MLYTYLCQKCGNTFEEYRSVNDRNNAVCCGEQAQKLISEHAVGVDSTIRDVRGTPIWFPKVGGYYDKALQKRFESKKQKAAYMKKNKFAMDGSYDGKRTDPAAGDTRKTVPIYSTPK